MRGSLKLLLFLPIFIFIGCSSSKSMLQSDNSDIAKAMNKDFISQNPLHDAVRANDLELVKFLVSENSPVNLQDKYGYTPLHLAVRLHNLEIVEFLITNGANPNSVDRYKDTPLLDATRNNDTDIAKLLICNKANRDVRDVNNISTLNYSSKNNNKYISQLLRSTNLSLQCKSDVIVEEDINKQIVKEKIEFTINDLSKLESSKPIICGKVISKNITKVDFTLTSNKEFGPYEASLNIEENTWCGEVTDELKSAPYTIAVTAYGNGENKLTTKEQFYLQTTSELYDALQAEFENDFENCNCEIDQDSLTISMFDTTKLFEHTSSKFRNKLKDNLNRFIPRYIDQLLYFKDEISSIEIQGHTSSEYLLGRTVQEKFELNQKLSQERADAILRYIKDMEDPIVRENIVWVITTFNAIGKSSSKLIYDENNQEDKEKSRRIDFVINFKSK